ncbi:STAS domain-containing protein [Streptomyces sp. NBC_00377]|uniref:STAS domain-containing protein n=1 Tax=unclassified Streptomyces TaxID=2593676 RepID=UPI002E221F9E|nr:MULTISPECIES: STAS domain-containing protein [unclassified Streptomyces]
MMTPIAQALHGRGPLPAAAGAGLSGYGSAPPSRIVVDLGGGTFMDSSGINVFVTTHKAVSSKAGWLRIAAAQTPVLRVLRLVGIDTFITCHPTVEQALEP